MKKIHETVLCALKELELTYNYDEESGVFDYRIPTDNTSYYQRLLPLEELEILISVTTFPIMIPEDKRFMFVNLLNKLNLKLQLGYFVLDPEDGELTFRIVCPVDKGAINMAIVIVAIGNGINTMEKYFHEFLTALGTTTALTQPQNSEEYHAYA